MVIFFTCELVNTFTPDFFATSVKHFITSSEESDRGKQKIQDLQNRCNSLNADIASLKEDLASTERTYEAEKKRRAEISARKTEKGKQNYKEALETNLKFID